MKWKFLSILLLLFAVKYYGQVTIVGVSDEKEYRQNKKFTLTFIIQINGSDLVQESPIKLPDFSKFDELGSASEQNTVVDPRTGTLINQIVYQYVLQPKQSGKMKIGSALVQINGKMYKSESFDIFVKEAEKKSTENNSIAKTQDQVFLSWDIKEKEVYQHQPTVAILRVYSKDYDYFRKISKIQIIDSKEVSVEPMEKESSEIEPSEQYPTWLSQIIAVYSVASMTEGKVEIPTAMAQIKNNGVVEKLFSNKARLLVKALPKNSPKEYVNAIGDFEISLQKTSAETYQEIEKPFTITLKLQGNGNLNKVQLPVLYPSSKYSFYKPKIVKNYSPENGGFEGEISAQYIVIPHKAGEITVKTNNFSFFDTEKEEYTDLGITELPINVLTAEQISQNQSTIEKVNNYTNTVLEKVENPILKTTDFKVKEKSKINWKIVFGNLVLIFLLLYSTILYSKFRKNRKPKKIKPIAIQKPLGSVAETEAKIRMQKALDMDSYFNYFDYLAKENNVAAFFENFQEFKQEVTKKLNPESTSLETELERTEKREFLSQIILINKALETEKYNPNSTSENLQKLSIDIKKSFSTITF